MIINFEVKVEVKSANPHLRLPEDEVSQKELQRALVNNASEILREEGIALGEGLRVTILETGGRGVR